MEAWIVPLLGGIGVALLGLLGTIIAQWATRDKTRAEARSTNADYGVKVTASAISIINELQDDIALMRERQKGLENERQAQHDELAALRNEVTKLRDEVKALREENFNLRRELSAVKLGILKPEPDTKTQTDER